MQVTILRGIPGSGKSTYAKSIKGAVICSADDYFMVEGEYRYDLSKIQNAHRQCWLKFYEGIKSKKERIIIDNTNTTVAEIASYVLPAQANGYNVSIVNIVCDLETAILRATHGNSRENIEGMYERLSSAIMPDTWKDLIKTIKL